MPTLELDRLEKRYGAHRVVESVSLAVADGEFVSLLGPSGCGKTTVLRMIAGLIEPSAGRILIDGRDVTRVPTAERRIGLVFQSYALFPHLSVFENVAFGLRRQGIGGDALRRRVDAALAGVRLSGLAGRMPRQLSGGQQQRVAIARSIAPRPGILLFDEPLSNLDAALRDEMQIELKRLQREVGITTLFVTHDQVEAMSMSDRVCVMADGRVQQFASPEALYQSPQTGFVAGFIGRPNRLRGRVDGDGPHGLRIAFGGGLQWSSTAVAGGAVADRPAAGATVDVVIRLEDVALMPADPPAGSAATGSAATGSAATGGPDAPARPNQAAGRVTLRAFVGAQVRYVVALEAGFELLVQTPTAGPWASLEAGAPVRVAVDPARVFVSRPEPR